MTEVRHGGRNFIRTGDTLQFKDGGRWVLMRFHWADEDRGGAFYALTYADGKNCGWRFVRPERCRRTRKEAR